MLRKTLTKIWWTIDLFFEKRLTLVLLLALVVFLRIPSFFEPHYYMDEAIYLTAGKMLNHGKVLYKDFIDHKTPLIYYFASVGSQLNFRFLLLLFTLTGTSFFYFICKKILYNKWLVIISTLLFIFLTNTPTFEGLIPNGEIFGLVFVLIGVWFSLHSWPFSTNLSIKFDKNQVISGFFFALAVLTKAPFILDFFALLTFLTLFWLTLKKNYKPNFLLIYGSLIGFIIPIFFTLIWFTLNNALTEFMRYNLMFNLDYASYWSSATEVSHQSILSIFYYSPVGKISILFFATATSFIAMKKTKQPPYYWFAWLWSTFALVAAGLSNRPYPHYFLQAIPPLILLSIYTVDNFISKTSFNFNHLFKKSEQKILLIFTAGIILFSLFSLITLGWWQERYKLTPYYKNWLMLVTKQQTYPEYAAYFFTNWHENAIAGRFIQSKQAKEIFIWGNNPMLYVESQTVPATPYSVLFHANNAKLQDDLLNQVITTKPAIIVTSKSEFTIPIELTRFLSNNYHPSLNLDSMTVWQFNGKT